MKTELLGQEKNIVKIKLEIEADEFSNGLNSAVKSLSQKINIPGFRKGRATRRIIEMRFGRDALYNEALEKILPENIRKIIDDYELETIDTPSVNAEAITEGQPVICELKFEVMPEVELPDIENIEVERLKSEVRDEALEQLVWSIRRRYSEQKPVERPVEKDDVVNVDFTIYILDDKNNENNDYDDDNKIGPDDNNIDLADKSVRKEVAEALTGHSKGDTVETEFDIEPGHVERRIAGKHVRYVMNVKQVYECVMPELNEDLFKKYYGENTDIKTEEAFRAKLFDDLKDEMTRECNTDAENRAMDKIVKLSKLDVPETLIVREAVALRKNDEEMAHARYNAELRDVLGDGSPDWEKGYNVVLRSRAAGVVRYSLVVNAIAKKYDVTVEKEDIDAELERRAKLFGVDKSVLVSYFYKNQNELNQLVNIVHDDKVTKAVMGLVKIKEVDEITPEKPEDNNDDNKPENSENQGE